MSVTSAWLCCCHVSSLFCLTDFHDLYCYCVSNSFCHVQNKYLELLKKINEREIKDKQKCMQNQIVKISTYYVCHWHLKILFWNWLDLNYIFFPFFLIFDENVSSSWRGLPGSYIFICCYKTDPKTPFGSSRMLSGMIMLYAYTMV